GIEPGPALQQLETAVLRQDPELRASSVLDATRPRQVILPPSPLPSPPPGPQPPHSGEARKLVTALQCELETEGVDGAALDPESLRPVLSRALSVVRDVAVRHGGTVERPRGHSITVLFGVPVVREDDAQRAVRAATELRDALEAASGETEREWNAHVACRC